MVLIARRFVAVSEATNQSEAEFRYALTRLSDNGESIALLRRAGRTGRIAEIAWVCPVRRQWLLRFYQHIRAPVVCNGNLSLAPVVPLVLCAPKYLDGSMMLGEVMHATGAF